MYIGIILLLAASGTFIYYMQGKALYYKNKYPYLNCKEMISENYGDWSDTIEERMLVDAKKEYR